jgi:hypothetical protein
MFHMQMDCKNAYLYALAPPTSLPRLRWLQGTCEKQSGRASGAYRLRRHQASAIIYIATMRFATLCGAFCDMHRARTGRQRTRQHSAASSRGYAGVGRKILARHRFLYPQRLYYSSGLTMRGPPDVVQAPFHMNGHGSVGDKRV